MIVSKIFRTKFHSLIWVHRFFFKCLLVVLCNNYLFKICMRQLRYICLIRVPRSYHKHMCYVLRLSYNFGSYKQKSNHEEHLFTIIRQACPLVNIQWPFFYKNNLLGANLISSILCETVAINNATIKHFHSWFCNIYFLVQIKQPVHITIILFYLFVFDCLRSFSSP